MALVPRSQIRLIQLTGSLPVSTGSALASAPSLTSFNETINEIASSIRRIIDFDTTSTNFYDAPKTFKSMGTENRFVITTGNSLFVSGTTFTTQVTGSTGIGLKASTGNIEIEGASGVTFIENGTEVLIIDDNRNTKFAQSGGSALAPDIEIDGVTRFDNNLFTSGSMTYIGTSHQVLAKTTPGKLTFSSSLGSLNFVDANVTGSTWSGKQYGLPLSTTAAQWSTLQSLGFASLIDALIGGGTNDKVSGSLAATVSAGNPTGVKFNTSLIPASARNKRIDVYLNGMLMLSGSTGEVNASSADYRLDISGGLAVTDTIFSDDLAENDVIQIILR